MRSRSVGRGLVLTTLVAMGVLLWWWRRADPDPAAPRLAYVATAHQQGVVGYRDPVGVLSHDGARLAFVEGRRLFVTLPGGGARTEIAAATGQIRHLVPSATADEWIFEDTATPQRWWITRAGGPEPLFGSRAALTGTADGRTVEVRIGQLRQIASSRDGQWIAGVNTSASGAELWRAQANGDTATMTRVAWPVAWPAWTPSGDVACTVHVGGRWRLSNPCGRESAALEPDVEVIGPLAFASRAPHVYFASPNGEGTVDLWRADLHTRNATRLTTFARDSYAPVLAPDDAVLFKVQSYRTHVAELDLASGRIQQLSTLQAETPSYHPDGRRIAVTYGTWRRVMDDAKYPDIAQEIGVIPSMPVETPAHQPVAVIAASDSEDQAMTWSPNGRWIVFHSHQQQSDDIWIQPADGTSPAARRVSFLGRGAEVGWPRWSPDGRSVLYDGASPSTGRSVMFVVGIDQDSGAVTADPREVVVSGFDGEVTHGEWLPDSRTIVAIAKAGPGRHAVLTVPAEGGPARVAHRFATEHDFPGLGVAPDGTRVVFVAPAPGGFHQLFTLHLASGAIEQLTSDPSHKTQPAWSPDGGRIAFTIWSYEVQFWRMQSAGP